MADVRIIPCPACDGDGGYVAHWDGYIDAYGSPGWVHCSLCERSGWIQVEVEPVEMDDFPTIDVTCDGR